MKISIDKARGRPALWECGGGRTNTGSAVIVAGRFGGKKLAVHVRKRGNLACNRHAMVLVSNEDILIDASHHRKEFRILVYRIVNIDVQNMEAEIEIINEYSQGKWSRPLPCEFEAAVNAAMEKATCYHCKSPHYVLKLSS